MGKVDYHRREVASRPVRIMPRPAFLAGREELLAELDILLADRDGAGPRVVTLCGLGGVGKTSVAVEYAHRQQSGLGLVWQLHAEDPAAMAAGGGTRLTIMPYGHTLPQVTGAGHILAPDRACGRHRGPLLGVTAGSAGVSGA